MTNYVIMYLTTYVVTLLLFQCILKSIFQDRININSLPQIIYYISRYSRFKALFIITFLNLSGLPPVILFFIKLNFLVQATRYTNFLSIILVLLFFLLNMLFYLQVFAIRNIAIPNDFKLLKANKFKYNLINWITFITISHILGVCFLTDLTSTLIMINNWRL